MGLKKWFIRDEPEEEEPVRQPRPAQPRSSLPRPAGPPVASPPPLQMIVKVPEGLVHKLSELPSKYVVLTHINPKSPKERLVITDSQRAEVAVIAFPAVGPNARVWRLTVQGWSEQNKQNIQAAQQMNADCRELGLQGSPKDLQATADVICQLNGVDSRRSGQNEEDRREVVVQRAAAAELSAAAQSQYFKAFYQILVRAVMINTADVHIEVRYGNDPATGKNASRIRFRVDGDVDDITDLESDDYAKPGFLRAMIAFMFNNFCINKSETQFAPDLFLAAQQTDMRIGGVLIRGRVQTFDMSGTQSENNKPFDFVMRILYAERVDIPTLEQLGFLPWQIMQLQKFINAKARMACLSGKVGSGKSTTLRSLFAMLPLSWKKYAVEDPVEYFHPNCSQVAASDAAAMQKVVKAMKRGDLNALLMGEVRNVDTMGLVRNIAFSGHQVFTTTHSESALGQIPYFLTPEMGLDEYQIANPAFIGMLFHQVLVRKLCPHCALEGAEARSIIGVKRVATIEEKYRIDASGFRARNEAGCEQCRAKSQGLKSRYGFMGQDVLAEMFVPTLADLALIEAHQSIELTRRWRSSHAAFDSGDCTGKTCQEVGLYKALIGRIDPRSIEERTRPFADTDVYWSEAEPIAPVIAQPVLVSAVHDRPQAVAA